MEQRKREQFLIECSDWSRGAAANDSCATTRRDPRPIATCFCFDTLGRRQRKGLFATREKQQVVKARTIADICKNLFVDYFY